MRPPVYGDTYRELLQINLFKVDASANKTFSQDDFKWNLYQYGCCSLFIFVGCIILCPLLQRRNYKSKQRRKILIIDALSLLFCLFRAITLLFSYEQNDTATACLLFFWTLGTTFFVTAIAVFLFILWSTTKLEPMIWRFRNSLTIACIIVANVVTLVCKELALNFFQEKDIHTWMSNMLLVSSLINGSFYFILAFCFCGTFMRMTRNRRPSIKLVKESTKLRFKHTKVVHTDVKNFKNMVMKLRLIACLTFLRFAINFYTNIKMIVAINSQNRYMLYEWEIYALEMSLRFIEISAISVIFCIGFFSPQHKEAAKQWIRGISLSKSHEELSVRRTNSVDSGRDTASDGKSRADTLDIPLSEYSNETSISHMSSIEATVPMYRASKSQKYICSDLTTNQNANYLMVPNSLPQTLIIQVEPSKA